MGYINEKTGTTQGPIQLELNGPWLSHVIEGNTHIINVQQFSSNTEKNDTGYVGDEMYLRVKTPGYVKDQKEIDDLMVPNVAWIKSYVYDIKNGGDPIDISKYATTAQVSQLKGIVDGHTTEIAICKAELTNISKDVKIVVDWKSEIEESILVLDGCKPDGTPHYTVD